MTTRRVLQFLVRVLAPAALLSSCALDARSVDESVDDDEQRYTNSASVWYAGNPSVLLGDATSDYFCALSGLGGPFYGAGEEVYVTRAPVIGQPGTYRWYLGGKAQQPRVEAYVHCARGVLGYTGETAWAQGEPPKDLGPTSDRVCFLSRIGGHFMGDGEQVRTRKSNGRWLLDGLSQQVDVHARARCVYVNPDFTSASEHYVHNGGSGAAQLKIGGNVDGGSDDDFCALTRIRGQLDGPATALVAYGKYSWYNFVRFNSPGPLGIGSRCLFHEFIIR